MASGTVKRFGQQLLASGDVNRAGRFSALRLVTGTGPTATTITIMGSVWLNAGVPAANNVLDIPLFELDYEAGEIVLTTLGSNTTAFLIHARSAR